MNCPKCDSDEVKLKEVTEFDYTFKQHVLISLMPVIGIAIIIGIFFVNMVAGMVSIFVGLLIWCGILKLLHLYKQTMKRKPRPRCTCQKCGYIWYPKNK